MRAVKGSLGRSPGGIRWTRAGEALVQQLLEGCISIKVKRLFLFLVMRQDAPWSRKLKITRITLGQGKRQVTRGGRLNVRFSITVPEQFSVTRR